MKIVAMHVSKPETHQMLRPFLERVMTFLMTFNSEANPDVLYAELSLAYFAEQPRTLMWVALNDKDEMVSHLIATIDSYYGYPHITIHQAWIEPDTDAFPMEQRAEFLDALKNIGRQVGCKEIRIFAMNEKVAKVFEGYGFKRDGRVTMGMEIEGEGESNVSPDGSTVP